MDRPFLSVIIPAYNEEARLEPSLGEITRYFAVQPYTVEIVVVDDGSTDRTCEIVEAWAKKSPVKIRLERNPRNMGKGAAVRRGMLAGAGEYLLFFDADLSTSLDSMQAFLPHIEQGAKVIIGTRRRAGANIERRQPWLRQKLGKCFIILSNTILGLRLSDFNCGFKCFAREAGREVFARSRVIGWAFDAEVLYLSDKLGYEIVEVPVIWAHSEGSRVRLRKDIFSSFCGLLEIRRNNRQGLYEQPGEEIN